MGRRLLRTAAGIAGSAAGALLRFGPSVTGVCLVSYGAWLAWAPAGFIVAGGLLLADQIAGRGATR
jgi:hypothetical protein